MPLRNDTSFAGYSIVRLLGAGGMGEVYLARHPRLPRQDALKILPVSVSSDESFRHRFEREADLAATLWHQHIVGVHDRGEFEGRLWISMDYVEGTDAARLSREQYPNGMPMDEVAEIVESVADALDYAHEQQLLHRDVKPANILIANASSRDRRRILLADFGIARHTDDVDGLTATNMTVGSVSYTAPEQLTGEALDGRADQYALAATAFHLLTGAPPFSHSNPAVVIGRHLNTPPPKLGESNPQLAGLDTAILRALAKDPEDRFPTCSDFAQALLGAAGDTAPAPPSVQAMAQPAVDAPTTVVAAEPTVQHASPPMVVSSWATAKEPTVQAPADPPSEPATPSTPQAPVRQGISLTPKTWALIGAAVIIVVLAIALIANITGSDETAGTSAGSQSPSTIWYAPSTTLTTIPAPTSPTAAIRPPLVQGPDAFGETCGTGYQLPNEGGWASHAGRGTPETSCFFTYSVLQAYWDRYQGPGNERRSVVASGTVPCSSTGAAQCAGDKFLMTCAVYGSDQWITCTGGNNARIYLY